MPRNFRFRERLLTHTLLSPLTTRTAMRYHSTIHTTRATASIALNLPSPTPFRHRMPRSAAGWASTRQPTVGISGLLSAGRGILKAFCKASCGCAARSSASAEQAGGRTGERHARASGKRTGTCGSCWRQLLLPERVLQACFCVWGLNSPTVGVVSVDHKQHCTVHLRRTHFETLPNRSRW